MRSPWFVMALRLAAENRRLTANCEQLCTALHLANDAFDEARMDLRRVEDERDGYQRMVRALMETCPSTVEELDRG